MAKKKPKSTKSDTPKPQTESQASPLTIEQLHQELKTLKDIVEDHTQLIAFIQVILSKKRKPPKSNGKIQVLDKETDTLYPSKNNAYQSLFKSGELKSLVDKGVFGPTPEKNTFGWYVLERMMPGRFQEVNEDSQIQNAQ
jgi:hypothetical protein